MESKSRKINNMIQYEGFVKVVFKDKNGKIRNIRYHNEGELPLFTSVCRALAGYDITKYKPFYIMLYTKHENDTYSQALVSNIVYNATPTLYQFDETSSTWVKNTQLCDTVEYVFTIPITAVSGEKTNDELKINKLALLNMRGEECAQVILEDTDSITIEATATTSNILIYWKMKFSDNSTAATNHSDQQDTEEE